MENLKDTIQYYKVEDFNRLSLFLDKAKEKLYSIQIKHLQQQPLSAYISHLLNDPKGQQRVKTYIDCFEEGLRGNLDLFIADQKHIGQIRAVEGYTIFDISHFIMPFRNTLRKVIKEYNAEVDEDSKLDIKDIFYVQHLLDYSWLILSRSMIDTKNKIISRNRDQMNTLQRCTASLISVSGEEEIRAVAIQNIANIYNLSSTFWTVKDGKINDWKQWSMSNAEIPNIVVEKVVTKIKKSAKQMGIYTNGKVVHLSKRLKEEYFTYIGVPIVSRQSVVMGILLIHDRGSSFRFSRFDTNLLKQFSYFMGVIIGNNRMSLEIEGRKEELSYLAGKLISIQEKERKKIAADIHDTVTQTLSGIGYKTLYCQKLAESHSLKLYGEFPKLQKDINNALHQCRQIVRELRPPSLDNLGIVSAFKKLIKDFTESENIEVNFDALVKSHIHSNKGIDLFRIFQEALCNISRHAKASRVDIQLLLRGNACVYLKVADNGQGFELSKKKRSFHETGLGLIIMRERTEDLGGEFKVTSKLGQGCILEATIPL